MFLALARTVWGFAKLVPWWAYVAIVAVVYHFAAVGMAEHRATSECNAKWKAKIAQERASYDKQIVDLKAKQQEVVTRTVIEYRDRVQIVKEKGDAIIKEVPVLVHSDCVLGGGMRVVHDSAASGDMPQDPARAAATAAPVDPVTLATTVAENYSRARQNAEQLVALQKLVTSLGETK